MIIISDVSYQAASMMTPISDVNLVTLVTDDSLVTLFCYGTSLIFASSDGDFHVTDVIHISDLKTMTRESAVTKDMVLDVMDVSFCLLFFSFTN